MLYTMFTWRLKIKSSISKLSPSLLMPYVRYHRWNANIKVLCRLTHVCWTNLNLIIEGTCTIGYTWSGAIANTNVAGSTGNGALSIAACQTACLSTVNCIGIDWASGNTAGQQCYLTLTTASGPRNNGTAIGVAHFDYYYNNCASRLRVFECGTFFMGFMCIETSARFSKMENREVLKFTQSHNHRPFGRLCNVCSRSY